MALSPAAHLSLLRRDVMSQTSQALRSHLGSTEPTHFRAIIKVMPLLTKLRSSSHPNVPIHRLFIQLTDKGNNGSRNENSTCSCRFFTGFCCQVEFYSMRRLGPGFCISPGQFLGCVVNRRWIKWSRPHVNPYLRRLPLKQTWKLLSAIYLRGKPVTDNTRGSLQSHCGQIRQKSFDCRAAESFLDY